MNPSATPSQHTTHWSFGPLLILLGALALFWAKDIRELGLGTNSDPGARAVPVALAALLILGGLWECILTWRHRRRDPGARNLQANPPAELQTVPDTKERRASLEPWWLLGSLALYLAGLPWLGFGLCSWMLAVLLMMRWGTRWYLAAGLALVLVGGIHLLFVRVFSVQLPPYNLAWP